MAARSAQFVNRMGQFPGPKKFKQYIVCHVILGIVLFLVYYRVNGGIIPFFLINKIPLLKIGPGTPTLYYFTNAENDGVNIKWFHGANSRLTLRKAMKGDAQMVEADVMLQGQGTDKQSLEPIMAKLPDTTSDINLEEWLALFVTTKKKGFKLDFQSTDAVEITLEKLKAVKHKLQVPVWLHANIIKGPLGHEPRVDGIRFIKHVQRLFPECTLSLGWTTGTHTDLSQKGYTWNMTLDMYHFVHAHEIEPPIVFTVRASLIRNSVPQLKWLTDNTRGSILVYQPEEDKQHVNKELMHIAYRFDPATSFWDISNPDLDEYLNKNRHLSKNELDPLVHMRDNVAFRPMQWLKMGLHVQQHSVLGSEEALVLTSKAVFVLTKGKYRPSPHNILHGRVMFINRKNRPVEQGETGLNIVVRSSKYNDFEHINGIFCFLGMDGQMKVDSRGITPPIKKGHQRFSLSSTDCYGFSVSDAGHEIIFTVDILNDCETFQSVKRERGKHAILRVPVPRDIGDEMHPFIVKLEDSNRYAVIDELHLEYNPKRQPVNVKMS
ncbi:Hypothetical predicted protein [Mytilus galloprovincialis]|uniref:Uncharacterized protein n=1 Tax=Mytilus galloprovincialis TaxID=29158 RepID=A0A8B6FT57_MYTGA|nr:Hypothetical predicted protein [Mytilus galloprovincialis]